MSGARTALSQAMAKPSATNVVSFGHSLLGHIISSSKLSALLCSNLLLRDPAIMADLNNILTVHPGAPLLV